MKIRRIARAFGEPVEYPQLKGLPECPFITPVVQLEHEESRPLLEYLFAHQVRPEFTCRFRWQPGSLAFWDNR